MENYKITVIVTVYNVAQYLDRCLQSVLRQTYTNLEIIVINDGSIDNSLKICQKYQKEDIRIVLISQENLGAVIARKKGIEMATGTYITFVDGDDWIDVDTYANVVSNSNGEDVIMYGLVEEYGYKTVKRNNAVTDEKVENILPTMLCNRRFFEFGILPNLVCKLIRTEIMKDIIKDISNALTMGDDAVFTYMSLAKAHTFRNLSITPYHYFQRNNSLVRKTSSQESIVELYKNMLEIEMIESEQKQWHEQVYIYMTFILQLKSTDAFVSNTSFYNKFFGKKILIYGAGNYGRVINETLQRYLSVTIAGVVDRDWSEIRKRDPGIMSPDDILKLDYDYIYIAILNENICKSVETQLVKKGIEASKIVYYKLQDISEKEIEKVIKYISK